MEKIELRWASHTPQLVKDVITITVLLESSRVRI